MNPITVIIADDDTGMRLIERKIIEKAEGFSLIAEAHDGEVPVVQRVTLVLLSILSTISARGLI